jgi:hypothetical protein
MTDLKDVGLELDENDERSDFLNIHVLMEEPDRFVGELVYMHSPSELPPDYDMVQTGRVTLTDDDKDSGKQFWRVSFGEYTQDLDEDETIMYCIDKADGTTAHPHERFLSTPKGDLTRVKSNILVFRDSVDSSELPTYCTKDNETFIDVLQHVNIIPDQWHPYYQWIGADFESGHVCKGKTLGLHFVNPWGVNTRKTMKPLTKQSRFNDGQNFPMATRQ